MAAHQAPPSLGFSRREQWSGLPFPSPMHESEKWKWSHAVLYDSSWPHGLQPTRLLRLWDFPSKSIGMGCHCLLCHYRGLECKSRKSRDTWSNRQNGLGGQKRAGQRLTEFFQENTLVIANTLFQQHKRQLYTWTSADINTKIKLIIFFAAEDGEAL